MNHECEIEFTGICFFCKLTTTKRLIRASCTCKKCQYCNNKISKHCPVCHKPTCAEHLSKNTVTCTDSVKRTPCNRCYEQLNLLVSAGDTKRLNQLQNPNKSAKSTNKNDYQIEFSGLHEIVHVRLHKSEYIIKINVNQKCKQNLAKDRSKQLKEELLHQIKKDITQNLVLYHEYQISGDFKIIPGSKFKEIKQSSLTTFELYQLSVDIPLYQSSLFIDSSIIAEFTRSNHYSSKFHGETNLSKLLEINQYFYNSFSSILLGCDWISPEYSLSEAIKWENAKKIASLFQTALEKPDKIGNTVVRIVKLIYDCLQSNQQVYLPLTWIQEYSLSPDQMDPSSSTSLIHNNNNSSSSIPSGNRDSLPNDQGHSQQDANQQNNESAYEEGKKMVSDASATKKMEETALLWVVITPTGGVDRKSYTIEFINTCNALKSLFPECVQAHVLKQNKKQKALSKIEKKKDQFPTSVGELAGSMVDTGLKPGTIGSINKIEYNDVPLNQLFEGILPSLLVMQALPRQRSTDYDGHSLAGTVSTFFKLFQKTSEDNYQDPEENESQNQNNQSANNEESSKFKTFGNVVNVALRSRVGASGFVPLEEMFCDNFLESRSISDGELLEGHCIHILQGLFGYLDHELKLKKVVHRDATSPLIPGNSLGKNMLMIEKFLYGKKLQLQIELLRNLFLLRSVQINSSISIDRTILKDAIQSIYLRSMNHSFIFDKRNQPDSRIRELEQLKGILDQITDQKILNKDLPNELHGNINSVSLNKFHITSLVPSVFNTTDNLLFQSNNSNQISWPASRSPSTLQLSWFNMKYEEFSAIWNSWFIELNNLHRSKDFTTLRSLLYSISRSIPNDWVYLDEMLEHIPENWIPENNANANANANANVRNNRNNQNQAGGGSTVVTRQLWINKWAIILLRITQYYSVIISHRLSIHLNKHETFHKWGLKPEELLTLMKMVVLSDKLFCLAKNKEVRMMTSERRPVNFTEILAHVRNDHYLHHLTTEENHQFMEYVKYMNDRVENNRNSFVSTYPQAWTHENNSTKSQAGEDGQLGNEEEGNQMDMLHANAFDSKILDFIAARAEAYYGGIIPNIDSFGNRNLSEQLARALSQEKQKFTHEQKKKLVKAKVHYNNLKNPRHKKTPKMGGLTGIIDILQDAMGDDESIEIESDFEYEGAYTAQEKAEIERNRMSAHTWLQTAYGRDALSVYKRVVDDWFQDHLNTLHLSTVEKILKQQLQKVNMLHLSLADVNDSVASFVRERARDRVMLGLF